MESEINYETILEYNKYFKDIDKTYNKSESSLDTLLIYFNKYLLDILFLNNNLYLRVVLENQLTADSIINPINEIKENLIHIINFFASVCEEIDIDQINEQIKHKYCELICKGIFVIYQYYYLYIHSEKTKKLQTTIGRSKTIANLKSQSIEKLNSRIVKRLNSRSKTTKSLNKKQSSTEIDKLDSKFKIEEMLQRNTDTFNRKFKQFINSRIDDAKINKDTYTIRKINILSEDLDNSKIDDDLIKKCIILYKIIIIEFNKLFYNINEEEYITYPMDNELIGSNNAIEILTDEERLKHNSDEIQELKQILAYQLNILTESNDELLEIKESSFITIPQYGAICWFISMLTCLTYSDKNKQLLLEKKEINEEKIIDIKDFSDDMKSDEIFVSFIYYIIDKITKDFNKYNKQLKKNCDLFYYLKKVPIFFLTTMIDEYKNKFQLRVEQISKKDDDKKQPPSNTSLFNYLRSFVTSPEKKEESEEDKLRLKEYCENEIKKNNVNVTNFINKKISDDNSSMKLSLTHFSIIKLFYSLLNINCAYIYKIGDNYHKTPEKNTNYDVIIIDYTYIINNDENVKKNVIKNTGKITDGIIEKLENKNIKFNGEIYEIDYVLHATDTDLTCHNCGHCISNIQYQGEEYYYNSTDSIKKIKCGDETIKIPCNLIKEEWKTKLDSDRCYKLPKCKYLPEYTHDKIKSTVKEILKNSSHDNICFNNSVNTRICYVKQQ